MGVQRIDDVLRKERSEQVVRDGVVFGRDTTQHGQGGKDSDLTLWAIF